MATMMTIVVVLVMTSSGSDYKDVSGGGCSGSDEASDEWW